MSNLDLYEKFRSVPKEAQKEIPAGRLKGMTDINPMWRIKALTEAFGVCGIGWKLEIEKLWLETGADDEVKAFALISLSVKQNDFWSEKIPGIGGSSFISKESKGLYNDDECFKKAVTDAIGVACKSLGIGADVYWAKDSTKYDALPDSAPAQKFAPPKPAPLKDDPILKCSSCGATLTIPEHDFSVSKYKKPLCRVCQKKI